MSSKLLHRTFLYFLVKSIRNRDLVEEWISDHVRSEKIFKVTRKLCFLLNVTISDEMERWMISVRHSRKNGKIIFGICTVHCTLVMSPTMVGQKMNIQDISTEPGSRENTNKYLANKLLLTSGSPISSFRKMYTLHAFFDLRPKS